MENGYVIGVSEPVSRNFKPLTTLRTQAAVGVPWYSGLMTRAPLTRPLPLIVNWTFILPFFAEVRLHVRTWANDERMTDWTSSFESLSPPAGFAAGFGSAFFAAGFGSAFFAAGFGSAFFAGAGAATFASCLGSGFFAAGFESAFGSRLSATTS